MSLRKPDYGSEHENGVGDEFDYDSSQVRDLRDAMNEWIEEQKKMHAEAYQQVGYEVGALIQRVETLENMLYRGGSPSPTSLLGASGATIHSLGARSKKKGKK
jgi:hypothetical protein